MKHRYYSQPLQDIMKRTESGDTLRCGHVEPRHVGRRRKRQGHGQRRCSTCPSRLT